MVTLSVMHAIGDCICKLTFITEAHHFIKAIVFQKKFDKFYIIPILTNKGP